jgi:chromosome partitioning protein
VKSVINMLKLPLDDRGARRAAARGEWFAGAGKPLDTQRLLCPLRRLPEATTLWRSF